ncbi:hypothetical protein D3C78_1763370 [compost metagenome]
MWLSHQDGRTTFPVASIVLSAFIFGRLSIEPKSSIKLSFSIKKAFLIVGRLAISEPETLAIEVSRTCSNSCMFVIKVIIGKNCYKTQISQIFTNEL